MADKNVENMFKAKVLGHPAGLFVLFFTEMWERFSFYGMRVLLVNFLTMYIIGVNPGWDWPTENAGAVYATYAGLLYLIPILGGVIADKFLGYRKSVAIGALVMALGHGCMAMETTLSFYLGLTLLVVGTGFFKPNITSIISEMYKDLPEKKDGAYTIFYMGVNAGAFFGMMLCGYLAESIGWSWGFGLAGIFMLLGLLQFWLAKPIFEGIGEEPLKKDTDPEKGIEEEEEEEIHDADHIELHPDPVPKKKQKFKLNPFTPLDRVLTVISAFFGTIFLLHKPFAINGYPLIPEFLAVKDGNGKIAMGEDLVFIVIGLLVFFMPLIISRISRYEKVLRNRMIAFIVFAFFTVFFWMSFEQGASSLILFARDYTDRVLDGGAATAYLVVDLLLTFGPLIIVTWVLYRLWYETRHKILGSNLVLALCFALIWGLGIWKTYRDMNTNSYSVEVMAQVQPILDEDGKQTINEETGEAEWQNFPITKWASDTITAEDSTTVDTLELPVYATLDVDSDIKVTSEGGTLYHVDEEMEKKIHQQVADNPGSGSTIIDAKVLRLRDENQVVIKVSWFSILNSFFIIAFASFFSKWWESKYNPSAAVKYGLGLIIMAIGFGLLAFGSQGIGESNEVIRVSLIWLVLAYLFHTLGELCLSPVGLSYVSKLVPARMIAFMFGMWYLAIAIGNYAAGYLGGMIETIKDEYSMSTFFLIFTLVPAAAGILVMILHRWLKRLMGGVK